MHQISALSPASLASGHLWQIWLWLNFWAVLDLVDFNEAAVHIDYLQLKVVLARHHLAHLTV